MPEDKIKTIFASNLNHYLNLNNKTQSDLVKFIGVSSSTVSNWCTGQKIPRADKIQAIAGWMSIDIGNLMQTDNKTALKSNYVDFAKKLQDAGVSNEEMEKMLKVYYVMKGE